MEGEIRALEADLDIFTSIVGHGSSPKALDFLGWRSWDALHARKPEQLDHRYHGGIAIFWGRVRCLCILGKRWRRVSQRYGLA